jgi:peptidyl-prolyl cis-trans isomerase SurA
VNSQSGTSYLTKKPVIAIASGSAITAIIISVFLFYSPIVSDDQIPGSNITDDMDISQIKSGLPDQFSVQSDPDSVIALVNGEDIRLRDLKEAQAIILAQTGQQMQDTALLDQLVTKELLLQEAERRNISVTRDEARSSLEQQITQSGTTVDQFEQSLAAQGTTLDDTVTLYREQIIIDQTLEDTIASTEFSVSESESQSFFDENIDTIKSQFGEDVAYDDVAEIIESTILQQKQQSAVTDVVNHLKSNADITTYPDRL